MAGFTGRGLYPLKKALAITVLSIDRMPGIFQNDSDVTGMKMLFDQLSEFDVELEHYTVFNVPNSHGVESLLSR